VLLHVRETNYLFVYQDIFVFAQHSFNIILSNSQNLNSQNQDFCSNSA